MKSFDLPIWVINLKKDKERREFMTSQLGRLGLSFEIVEAVDGSILTNQDLKSYSADLALKTIHRQLIPNEIGCALSHIGLWERMMRENIAEALIFEDDALISEAFLGVLANRDKLPENWEHINFTTWARVVPFGDFIYDIYRAAKYLERPFLASAYLLTKSGAEKLLSKVFPLYIPIDDYFSIVCLSSYAVEPQVVSLKNTGSSIGTRKKGVRPKPKFLKRKHREFIEMIRASLIFFGVREEWIVNVNKRIRSALKSQKKEHS
ncbi:MAG: glycosyltransferase family 25 protein [Chloroflexi bacterium]|jgi:glycosyl transferase family 25|nr:glycosyltransferase family 25 protein [Chloroflexota bacterium]